MAIESMKDLFFDTLRDVFWAEKHLLKVLPKMAKHAANSELASALEEHRVETEGHVRRLERVFESLNKPARGKKCDAMIGLTAEGDHILEETDNPSVRDAGIIASAQAVEHYEIARYGTLVAWARLLELEDAAHLLEQTLEEEKRADEILTDLADMVNPAIEENRRAA